MGAKADAKPKTATAAQQTSETPLRPYSSETAPAMMAPAISPAKTTATTLAALNVDRPKAWPTQTLRYARSVASAESAAIRTWARAFAYATAAGGGAARRRRDDRDDQNAAARRGG